MNWQLVHYMSYLPKTARFRLSVLDCGALYFALYLDGFLIVSVWGDDINEAAKKVHEAYHNAVMGAILHKTVLAAQGIVL